MAPAITALFPTREKSTQAVPSSSTNPATERPLLVVPVQRPSADVAGGGVLPPPPPPPPHAESAPATNRLTARPRFIPPPFLEQPNGLLCGTSHDIRVVRGGIRGETECQTVLREQGKIRWG